MGTDNQHVLTFEIDHQLYSLPLSTIGELVHIAELVCPPERPPFLHGFLNLEGQLIAVIDMCTLWNLSEQISKFYTPLIILKDRHIALKVDAVHDVCAIKQKNIQASQKNHTLNNCIEAECNIADKSVHMLNIDQLLLSEEHARIGALKHRMEHRLQKLEVANACTKTS